MLIVSPYYVFQSLPGTDNVHRHKSSQTFNRYRTIDKPPPPHANECHRFTAVVPAAQVPSEIHPALPRTRIPRQRPRYSMKTRTRIKQHDPPEILKQYRLKPYTKVPDNPAGLKAKAEDQPSIQTNSAGPESNRKDKSVNADTKKDGLVRGMSWEHPTVTMNAGTLSVNIKRAMGESPLVSEVKSCLKEAVRLAFQIKRCGQQIIGQYIEAIFASGDELRSTDRDILNSMCPSVSSRYKDGTDDHDQEESADNEKNEEQEMLLDDSGQTKSVHLQFHKSLLSYLLTGKPPSTKFEAGRRVQQFIDRTTNLGLSYDRGPFVARHSFPPSTLLRSVAAELFRDVRKLYRNGSIELEKKVRVF